MIAVRARGGCSLPPTPSVCHDVSVYGCGVCGFDWELNQSQLVQYIGRVGSLYRAQADRLLLSGGRTALRDRSSPEVWSPLEYLVHMRDVVDFYVGRIERILVEDRPQLSSVGFAALADVDRYNDQNVEDALTRLDELSSLAASRLAALEPLQWRRVGIGTDGDERDILTLARRLAHEAHHHLLDVAS